MFIANISSNSTVFVGCLKSIKFYVVENCVSSHSMDAPGESYSMKHDK